MSNSATLVYSDHLKNVKSIFHNTVRQFYLHKVSLYKKKSKIQLTEMKMRSAATIAPSMFVEKNKFLPRHFLTISSRPGCKTNHTKIIIIIIEIKSLRDKQYILNNNYITNATYDFIIQYHTFYCISKRSTVKILSQFKQTKKWIKI